MIKRIVLHARFFQLNRSNFRQSIGTYFLEKMFLWLFGLLEFGSVTVVHSGTHGLSSPLTRWSSVLKEHLYPRYCCRHYACWSHGLHQWRKHISCQTRWCNRPVAASWWTPVPSSEWQPGGVEKKGLSLCSQPIGITKVSWMNRNKFDHQQPAK